MAAAATTTTFDPAQALVLETVRLADWLVILPVALPLAAGAILLMLRHSVRLQAGFAGTTLLAVFLACCGLLWRVASEGPLAMTMGRWLPPFGISFTADVLGALFAVTASLVALVCWAYSVRGIDGTGRRYGFYPFFVVMIAGVNGAFLTGDIFNLYVWFEVFVISSFGLLVLGSEREQIDGATKYAILNLVATTLFLIATGYLYGIFGTLNMADIARAAPLVGESAPLATLATLYLFAFGMKAAAFPVNFWLPASYHTPRIVVSALFGGLLTKIGLYALLRSLVVLFPVQLSILSGVVGWVAVATMLLGMLGALAQSDIRRMLGFLVISGIGVMMAGLALATQDGLAGAVLYGVHSMLVMTALYLLAGMMRQAGGSYALQRLGGLYLARPALAAIALALTFAAAGLPPMSGLWPKVMLVRASLAEDAWVLALSVLLTGILTTIALGRVFALAFWRPAPEVQDESVRGGRMGIAPVLALVIPALAIGLYPEPFIQLANAAAAGLLDPAAYVGTVFPVEAVQ